ncbi:MAG: DUF3299 domain-containing protein [Variovorax sp.]
MLRPFIAALLAVTLSAHVAAADPAPARGAAPRLITWEELVPKDWDPAKAFKGIDLAKLDDSDPRAAELLMKLQEASNNAPTNPAMNNVDVKIPGFLVPLEEKNGQVSEFLLVPYFGACIHTPPPPANQIIHVQTSNATKGLRAMDTIWVTGRMQTRRNDSMMGASGSHVTADSVTKYTGPVK